MAKNNSWIVWLIVVVAIVALVLAIVALGKVNATGNSVFNFGKKNENLNPPQGYSPSSQNIKANSCDADSVCEVYSLYFNNMTGGNISVWNITATNGTIWNLNSTNITAWNITVGNLTASNASVGNLTAKNITSVNITVTNLYLSGSVSNSPGYLCISSSGKVYRSGSPCV